MCVYVCNNNKFSTISKSLSTSSQRLPRFLIHPTFALVILSAEIGESYRSLQSILRNVAVIRWYCMCFAKNLQSRTGDSDFTQGTKFARRYRNRLNFRRPPFVCAVARNAIDWSAADASVRSRRSDIRKWMLNSLNKINYNRNTALLIVNSWSVCCLSNISTTQNKILIYSSMNDMI